MRIGVELRAGRPAGLSAGPVCGDRGRNKSVIRLLGSFKSSGFEINNTKQFGLFTFEFDTFGTHSLLY